MPANIRNRLLFIALLVVGSVFALLPHSQKVRERDEKTGAVREKIIRVTPLKLGLDLQGGMHMTIMLDESQKVSSDPKGDIDLVTSTIRRRTDEFGVAEPLVQKLGTDRIVVELAGISDKDRARQIVMRSAYLEFKAVDESGALKTAIPEMDRELARLGYKLPGAAASPDKGVASLLGKADSGKKADSTTAGPVLASLIHDGGGPGSYVVDEASFPLVDSLLTLPEIKKLWPRGLELNWNNEARVQGTVSYRDLWVLEIKPIVTGDALLNATATISSVTNKPTVNFELDRSGGRKFGDWTGSHIQKLMAIVLDHKVQGPPPYIKSRIDTRGEIEMGSRSLIEAQDLALTLKSGALKTPIKVVDERTVGASLGSDSIKNGITAGVVGTILVVIIMIGYYAKSGMLAVVGLGLYILFTLAALASLDATLTLPGLAGIVLSIGIAVDANVLIFERIREELAHGKSTGLAVDDGFHRAMNAIVDSNVCTILTAFILFQLGTGPVRGFATTLIIGTLASMVTAIFVTRTFFLLWLTKRPSNAPLSI